MIKFLLLALLGLGLGGGVWKAQNPDGALDDLKSDAINTATRLKSGVKAGVDAVVGYPEAQVEQASIDERLWLVEQELGEDNSDALAAELQAIVDEQLAENTNTLTSLQDTFDERVAPMEDMTVAVAALDTALQDTRARADAGTVRLDSVDRRLDLLVRRLDEQTTDTTLQTLTQSVEDIQGQVDTLTSENQSQIAQLNESLAGMNEQTDGLGLRLNTLITSANTAAVAESTPADGEPQPATALSLSAGIDERFGAIEERLATVNADSRRLATLNEQLQAANAKIEQLEQQDTQSAESLQLLSTSVEELNTVSESISIDTIQAQISDQLALAQSQFDSTAVDANTAQLEALLDTTRNRIQTLEQRVQGLPASSIEADDASQTQNALQAQIAALEQRLETLTGSDPRLENAVQDVKQQVEQLSAQGFVTQDDLRSQSESESVEYKIYFDRNSTDITEDAARVLNSFITQEQNRTIGVSIFGFTDRSGSAAYNQQLALQRATNVRSYLIQNGLDFTKITTLSGLGEDAAAAVLPDDAADAQQRVVVLYAAQP